MADEGVTSIIQPVWPVVVQPVKKYSDDEPRDELGRWTDEGGGGIVSESDQQGQSDRAGQESPGSSGDNAGRVEAYLRNLSSSSVARIDQAFEQCGKPCAKDALGQELKTEIPALLATATARGELLPPMDRPPDAKGGEHLVWFSKDGSTVIKETYFKDGGTRQRFGVTPALNGSEVRDGSPKDYLDRLGIANSTFGGNTAFLGISKQGDEVRIRISEPMVQGISKFPDSNKIAQYMNSKGFSPLAGTQSAWFNPSSHILAADTEPRNFIERTDGSVVPVDVMLRHRL